MMPRVLPADVVLWLTGWLRAELAALASTYPVCAGVVVRDKEPGPDETFPSKLVVVNLVSSIDTSIITSEDDYGVSTLAGTVENPKDANDLSRIVHALMKDSAGTQPGNPIAAVIASNGPYAVPEEQPRARRYSTYTLSTVGSAL
jgi:hypothetical protein